MIFNTFHKPTSNVVKKGSLYLMLLLAFATVFLVFQPVQQAEAVFLPVVLIAFGIYLIVEGCSEDSEGSSSSSSCLPSVPEFIDVLEEKTLLS